MVRMGSAVRFRRGAPLESCSSDRVHYPAYRMPAATPAPVRLTRSGYTPGRGLLPEAFVGRLATQAAANPRVPISHPMIACHPALSATGGRRTLPDDAAADASHQALACKLGEVAPHRHFRNGEGLRKFRNLNVITCLEQPEHVLHALRLREIPEIDRVVDGRDPMLGPRGSQAPAST